jgi:RNA polymerase sigma-70 factor (ECF subfamily)
VSEAEDVVQEAWLRWARGRDEVVEPERWLMRVVSRLCIDRLRASKAERAAYRGPWLPEPLIEPFATDPLERAEDVSIAFLLALERLSPLERAAFLLREVFEESYAVIAETLGRSETAVRQLASRARTKVREDRPRYVVERVQAERLTRAFLDAVGSADTAALKTLLAEDAIMVSDGGGKRLAALRVLIGRDDIVRLCQGVAWRWGVAAAGPKPLTLARINGAPGAVIGRADGLQIVALEADAQGRIAAVYTISNPDKLGHVRRMLGGASLEKR